ncbi:VOC family protein [Chitinimonas koreensis]|uniref:VOC family protein n=1 Tax=Chitinimonas koreensis TaxID=356302 RepID=UPI0004007508|nr:VOC family protein [Chitinimonas koreensis]QNM95181.1 VOC family protein [Chitinimonas koreensis]
MSHAPALSASFVIYAKDVARVAAFYELTLALPLLETGPGFILLGSGAIELAVVQIPDAIATEIDISTPPYLREETPLKFSFLVRDLEQVQRLAMAAGGGTQPLGAAWHWRGQLHLDGHDPEGNIVQFRQIAG